MTKKHVTTDMKWIDWNYLKGLASPLKEVVDVVYDRCQEMDLVDIMSTPANGSGKNGFFGAGSDMGCVWMGRNGFYMSKGWGRLG